MVGHHWWWNYRVYFLIFVFLLHLSHFVDRDNLVFLRRSNLVVRSGRELWWEQGVEIGSQSQFVAN